MASASVPVTPTTSYTRGSPAVSLQRNSTPFVNFFSAPPSHAHPEPSRVLNDEVLKKISSSNFPPIASSASAPPTADESLHSHPARVASTWLKKGGHGSKHVCDPFEFSLWNEQGHTYRAITTEELQTIRTTYSATNVRYERPFIIVATTSPPSPLPLTLGSAPAIFISPATDDSGWTPLLIDGNANYANPRVPDPAPDNHRKSWSCPSVAEMDLLASKLGQLANIKTMNFAYPFLLVELRDDDGRTYAERSLPGKIGGWTTTYHHYGEYRKRASLAKDRDMKPAVSTGIQDDTNYVDARKMLGPGVRLEGIQASTSCGVLLKKGSEYRITTAHHSFNDTEEVYHPHSNSILVGTIKERFPEEDLALIVPEEEVKALFTNGEYFGAEVPKRLIPGAQSKDGDGWYEVDGMSTGLVQLLCFGVSNKLAPDHVEFQTKDYLDKIYMATGVLGTEDLVAGICGAPIVSIDDGGVVGFFRYNYQGGLCYAPTLDKLIDQGWALA